MINKQASAVILFFVLCAHHTFAGQQMDAVRRSNAGGEAYTQAARQALPAQNPVMDDAAKKLFEVTQSPEYQRRIQAESERLQREVFKTGDSFADYYGSQAKGRLAQDERLYIFISESVPLATLRNYAKDMDRLKDPNIVMVLNGFIGNIPQFEPTVGFMAQIVEKRPGCVYEMEETGVGCELLSAVVEVDPNLFDRYRPKVVPALVYVKGIHTSQSDISEGDTVNTPPVPVNNIWTAYGDASLKYAAEYIGSEANSKSLLAISGSLPR